MAGTGDARLANLDLSHNNIGDEEASMLARALNSLREQNKALRTLHLYKNSAMSAVAHTAVNAAAERVGCIMGDWEPDLR